MTEINFQSNEQEEARIIKLNKDETVLKGLLREGYQVPFGCRAGICQSCLMQCSSNNVPNDAQKGLKETQKKLGYFLACSCVPNEKMDITAASITNKKRKAKVLENSMMNDNIIRLVVEKVIDYEPGQYCTLTIDDKVTRCYSIASVPEHEDYLEFHIKKVKDGLFSQSLYKDIEVGDSIDVQGPMGECFYTDNDKGKDLFLAGMGTGLAPLYGIVRKALTNGHTEKINLIVAAKQSSSLYMLEALKALEEKYMQLKVYFVVQEIDKPLASDGLHAGDVYKKTTEFIPDFKNQRVFLCGADSFVNKMKKQCFLAGANMQDISADPFLAFAN